MADYFTQFSCSPDVGTPANAAPAIEIFDTAVLDNDPDHPLSYGFSVSGDETAGGSTLWIRDEEFRNLGISGVPQLSTDDAWAALISGRSTVELGDDLHLRRVRSR